MRICTILSLAFLLQLAIQPLLQAKPIKILFFGDSLTAGYQLSKEEAYPQQVEQLATADGIPVTIYNAGVSGDTTSGGLSRLQWNLRRPFDLFVLALGANDGLRGIPLSVTRDNLRKILQTVREVNPQATLVVAGMQLPPNYGEEYKREFDALFAPLAKEFNATLIPFLLEGVAGVPELNLPDGIHPNPEGQKRVARIVWQALKPLLIFQAVCP